MSNASSVEALFFAALEKETAAERAAYLDSACGGDAQLRRQVEKLLKAHPRLGDFLTKPVGEQLAAAPEQAGATQEMGASTAGEGAGPAGQAGAGRAPGEGEGSGDDPGGDLAFLQPSTRPDSLGRLGHYEVLQVLGRGGFGIVFRAFDEQLQRVVAIKVLAPQLAATAPARKRFLREARWSAKVRHENVVQVYAVEEEPLPYLVMEFVPGETLQQRLDRTGPLATAEVLRIGRQLAEGLGAAHATGLIHRDIKPANILIEAGPGQHVKITDFGLARAADDASLTQSGLVAGTPMFMAPEQAQGDPLDHRADLFSLGSVLYTMASGRPPFRANSTLAVLRRVAEDTPRPIPEIVPEVPPWLCETIARLHAKKPADRFASAQEVADQLALHLDRMQHPAPAEAPPVAAPSNRRRHFRARRWVGAAAVLLVLFGGLGFTEATGVTDFRGTVIRLFSPEGTLVVEVDDPGVSVKIDGSDIVITGAGAQEIRLRPGRYTVEATRDGKLVRRELVTVTKNGRQVVRVSQEAPPVDAKGAGADGAAAWERAVAGLSAEQQVKFVAARLQKLNPDFDGKVKSTVANGLVAALAFSADHVSDISPVRALTGLRSLDCSGGDVGRGQLRDLSPLRGLALTDLACRYSPVSDLSPLEGMGLTSLDLRHTNVSDAGLKTLAGMKGLQTLSLWGTRVTDAGLKELAGLKSLQWLSLETTQVTDVGLKQVAGLHRLAHLSLYSAGSVTDAGLEELAGLKALRYLDLRGTNVTDAGARKLASVLRSLRIRKPGGVIEPTASLDPDRRAAAYVLSVGGTVKVNEQDQEIRAAADLPPESFRLTWVGLAGNKQVTDAGLAHFRDCKSLKELYLERTPVGDAGLAHLKGCKDLTHLCLWQTNVGDEALAHVKGCKAITHLWLGTTRVTDAGLSHLDGRTDLLLLDLLGTGVTDEGLAHLKSCRGLVNLSLIGTRVTDAGLAHLTDCKGLSDLYLRGTSVSDAGLAHLKDCKNLSLLLVQRTKVTAAGIDELTQTLPQCKIKWDGGVIEPR